MVTRRHLLQGLLGLLSVGTALAQKTAIVQKGKAVVCENEAINCPLGHKTCRKIDAPLVVGNNNREYPDSGQLFEMHIFLCETCGVFFTVL